MSIVDRTLREDPGGVYGNMSFSTRDRYRHVIESLGRRDGARELSAARRAVELAREATAPRERHVGFYLVDRGLPITFWCETRINCLDGEILALLARAGCKGINFGLESGSDDWMRGLKRVEDGQRAGVVPRLALRPRGLHCALGAKVLVRLMSRLEGRDAFGAAASRCRIETCYVHMSWPRRLASNARCARQRGSTAARARAWGSAARFIDGLAHDTRLRNDPVSETG
jgi:hypothetical protein